MRPVVTQKIHVTCPSSCANRTNPGANCKKATWMALMSSASWPGPMINLEVWTCFRAACLACAHHRPLVSTPTVLYTLGKERAGTISGLLAESARTYITRVDVGDRVLLRTIAGGCDKGHGAEAQRNYGSGSEDLLLTQQSHAPARQ